MDETWECAVCGGESAFERVPCADGHGEECPEIVCTRCGDVLLVGPGVVEARGVHSGAGGQHAA